MDPKTEDLTKALEEGWELIKSSSSKEYFLLMPPLKDRRRGTSASWSPTKFQGRVVMIPSYD